MRLSLLRFKEFQSSWKERHLSEIVGRLESGVSVNSEDFPASKDEYGILKTSCIANGYFFEHENKKIVATEIKRAKLNPSADSILVSRMNTPQLVGEVGYVRKSYPHLFVPDRLWLIEVADKERDSTKWLSQQLTTKRLKNVFSNIASGTSGSMKNIAQPNFLKIEISTPDFEEQTKIANFLTAVDEKISQLKQKCELLTQYKKGVMQQIFSQELRFKPALSEVEGDEDGRVFAEWENAVLGGVAKLRNGYTFKSETYSPTGQYRVITIANVQDGYMDIAKCSLVDAIPADIQIHQQLQENDIIISMTGNVGRVCKVKTPNCLLNQRVGKFEPLRITSDFLYFTLNQSRFLTEMELIAQGGAQKNIGVKDIEGYEITLPCVEEQIKIANFLTAIDEKITTTQTQLQAVKQYKQGLFQQMFV